MGGGRRVQGVRSVRAGGRGDPGGSGYRGSGAYGPGLTAENGGCFSLPSQRSAESRGIPQCSRSIKVICGSASSCFRGAGVVGLAGVWGPRRHWVSRSTWARPPTPLRGMMRYGCNGRPKTIRLCRKCLEELVTLDRLGALAHLARHGAREPEPCAQVFVLAPIAALSYPRVIFAGEEFDSGKKLPGSCRRCFFCYSGRSAVPYINGLWVRVRSRRANMQSQWSA